MITVIFGKPGAGKTSLMAHLISEIYETRRDELLKRSRQIIGEENAKRVFPLPLPDSPPIFSNFEATFLVGYEKRWSPYFLNPYYFGIENEEFPTQHILPGGVYFIDEAQKYYNSRKSGTFPDHVSLAFETHRHFEIDIYLGGQRPKLLDINIRDLVHRFLFIMSMTNETNGYGGVLRSEWRMREFENYGAVEEYLNTGIGGTELPPVVHEGNIFDAFNSFGEKKNFFPKDENGAAFHLLPFKQEDGLPDKIKALYESGEPKWFRRKEETK